MPEKGKLQDPIDTPPPGAGAATVGEVGVINRRAHLPPDIEERITEFVRLNRWVVESVAKVCHAANKAYCESTGDGSHVEYDLAPTWHRESLWDGVARVALGVIETGQDSHDAWMRRKQGEGWHYGPTKDGNAKTHPCMREWNELPFQERTKDLLFVSTATILLRHHDAVADRLDLDGGAEHEDVE